MIRVVILGSGNIGMDLLKKVITSKLLVPVLIVGRNKESTGLKKAREWGIETSYNGIKELIERHSSYDLVFDATSAQDHIKHSLILKKLNKKVVDMTPSKIGKQIVPFINIKEANSYDNVNMISCGGQASLPIAYAISSLIDNIEYIEVVSSIASKSVGMATRINIDEYLSTTKNALSYFCKVPNTKAILIVNPAEPSIDMQTSISIKTEELDLKRINEIVKNTVKKIQLYVPGYSLIVPPTYENGRIFVMVKVKGLGDFLPTYAGNLDIINCAAIATAEEMCGKNE